mgnify:FL=1
MLAFFMANAADTNVPSKFSIATFAISNYENNWQKELPLSKKTANTLVNSFKNNFKDKYPNVMFSSRQ